MDIATGAGHVALTFAPKCSRVVALDPTPQMLDVAAAKAKELGFANVETVLGWAEDLPFPPESFEGVTCRVAPHHFRDVEAFLAEVVRVLQPGGWFLLVDTIGIEDPQADEDLNELECMRDPSHVRDYTESRWLRMVADAGLKVQTHETNSFPHNAQDWLDRMNVAEPTRSRIIHRIIYSEGWLRDYLRPIGDGDTLTFRLHQILLRATK